MPLRIHMASRIGFSFQQISHSRNPPLPTHHPTTHTPHPKKKEEKKEKEEEFSPGGAPTYRQGAQGSLGCLPPEVQQPGRRGRSALPLPTRCLSPRMVLAAARTKRRARAVAGGGRHPGSRRIAAAPEPGGDTGNGRLAAARRGAARHRLPPPPPREPPPAGAAPAAARTLPSAPRAATRPLPGWGPSPPPLPRGRSRALRREAALAAGRRGLLAGGRGRGCGGADMPGLPRGRAALSRLIVREGQRRAGRPPAGGAGSAAGGGQRRTFLRTGRGLGAALHLLPRCGGAYWVGGSGAPSPTLAGGCAGVKGATLRLPPRWLGVAGLGGPHCTLRGLWLRSSKLEERVGGEQAGGRGGSRVASLGLPSAESASGLRHRGCCRPPGPEGQGRSPCGRSGKLKAWSSPQPSPVRWGGGTPAPTRRGSAAAGFGSLRLGSVN